MNISRRNILVTAITLWLVCVAAMPQEAMAQTAPQLPTADVTKLSGRIRAVRGSYHDTIDGEWVKVIVLNRITVYPPAKFKNKKQEQFYWRTVRDVRKTLPLAKVICQTLLETYEYIETFPTKKEREEYLKQMEDALFTQYKPTLKKLTKGQATVLCKLIKRETDQTGYDIIKAFLGSFRASFWQKFGKLFGVNIKVDYKPTKNEEDATIERVAALVETGQL